MAATLLVLFPLLLLVHTRAAWVALAVAIVLLCSNRMGKSRPQYRRHLDTDASM